MGTLTAACGFAAQCTSGFCGIAAGDACGTCMPEPAAGTSCATTGCGQTLVCVASTQQCQLPRDATQACDKTQPCSNGLTCVGATANASGVCQVQVTTAGGTCDPAHKTAPDCNDDDGLTCDTTTLQCIAQPIANATQACGVTTGVKTACSAGATCVVPTGTGTTGTCVAPAADNAACDTAAGPDCFFPARCIVTTSGGTAGTCELPGATTCM